MSSAEIHLMGQRVKEERARKRAFFCLSVCLYRNVRDDYLCKGLLVSEKLTGTMLVSSDWSLGCFLKHYVITKVYVTLSALIM